ncbi:uncharacterized protein [Dysidea avara]|uniref:uncharacterized protein isoform X3 n=1 Tax=Dysidea avara TaxID=196820 RepID=UPI00331EF8C3
MTWCHWLKVIPVSFTMDQGAQAGEGYIKMEIDDAIYKLGHGAIRASSHYSTRKDFSDDGGHSPKRPESPKISIKNRSLLWLEVLVWHYKWLAEKDFY